MVKRSTCIVLPALLAVGSSCAQAQPSAAIERAQQEISDYPIAAVVNEYRATCGLFTSQREAAENVRKAGWNQVADPAKTPMGPAIERTEIEGRSMAQRTGNQFEPLILFQKELNGDELFITLTEFTLAGRRFSGCRLFDLGERRSIPRATVESLVGRPAKEQSAMGMTVLLWQPGFTPAQPNFEIWSVPADSQPAIENKFDGLMLRMESIEMIAQ